MGAEHASRLALDQALVGAASTEVTSHLAGCATCQARIKALRDADQRFLAHTSPAAEVRGLEPRARSWPLICALGAVLGTAAVALIALRPPVERERAKGASVVTLLHRDTLQPLGSAPVSARETLLVRYSTRHPYFLLVGLESSGRAQTLIGDAEQRSLAIEPANGAVLGTGVQLDEYEGAELWVAILSSEPVDAAPLIVELQSRHRGLPQGVELGGLMASPLPADGEQMFWVLTKVPR